MTVFELEKILDEKLNKNIAEEWDNVGLLVGERTQDVSGIYITLELTYKNLKEAIERGANFIITHHPVLFSSIKKIIYDEQSLIFDIIKNNISVYCAHTNFDKIDDGLNDYFVNIMAEYESDKCKVEDYIRIFNIKKQTISKFITDIKSRFDVEMIKFIGDADQEIQKVAVVTGAGSEFIERAAKEGADIFITGDIKYHEAMNFYLKDINVIDLGHFHSEKIFSDAMELFINKNITEICNLNIFKSKKEIDPFKFL